MSMVRGEIGSQPAVWTHSLVAERAQHLPGRDRWVGVIGCGTSFYTAQSYASYRESSGLGRTDAFPASLAPPREWDCLIAISRSGTTTEVLDALSRARATKKLAVTTGYDGPLASAVDDVLALPFADEESVVQTRFATTALITLLISVGYDIQASVHDAAVDAGADLDSSVWQGARQFVFVGVDWTFGIANEAALKLREMAGQWSESYPAMEYRHGPISVADNATVLWGFGPRDEALIGSARAAGAYVHWPACDPIASLVAVQRLGLALAEAHGYDADAPKHLTRSVILASAIQSADGQSVDGQSVDGSAAASEEKKQYQPNWEET